MNGRPDLADETKRLARPAHEQLNRTIALMWLFIDVWADHNWGVWETALLAEADSTLVLTPTRSRRLLNDLGLKNKGDVFEAAGLTRMQRQVVEAQFPEGGGYLLPREIAQTLDWPTLRVRVYLHRAYERLRAWVDLVDCNDFPKDGGVIANHLDPMRSTDWQTLHQTTLNLSPTVASESLGPS